LLVDWVTVAAELVNFLVLVALLRYFLYGRVIRTVDEREAEIQSRLEDAERKTGEAARSAEEQDQRERAWEEEREERLVRAKEEAMERKSELVDEAREEVEDLRRRWHEALESDKSSFLRDLREGVGRRAYEIAREAVSDFADEELEGHVLRVFRERLRELNSERRQALKRAIEESEGKPRVVSAFEMGESARDGLARDLREVFGFELDLEFEFETSPGVLCGIELVTDGHKVGFSLGSYMNRLEEWAEETLASELGERSAERREDEGGGERRGVQGR